MIYRQVKIESVTFYVPEHLLGILTGILALSLENAWSGCNTSWGISTTIFPCRYVRNDGELTHEDTIKQAGV